MGEGRNQTIPDWAHKFMESYRRNTNLYHFMDEVFRNDSLTNIIHDRVESGDISKSEVTGILIKYSGIPHTRENISTLLKYCHTSIIARSNSDFKPIIHDAEKLSKGDKLREGTVGALEGLLGEPGWGSYIVKNLNQEIITMEEIIAKGKEYVTTTIDKQKEDPTYMWKILNPSNIFDGLYRTIQGSAFRRGVGTPGKRYSPW